MSESERERLIEAEWVEENSGSDAEFIADINVYAMDRNALIHDITKVFMESDIPIKKIEGRVNKQGKTTINVQFGVRTKGDMNVLISKIRSIQGIIDIERTQG